MTKSTFLYQMPIFSNTIADPKLSPPTQYSLSNTGFCCFSDAGELYVFSAGAIFKSQKMPIPTRRSANSRTAWRMLRMPNSSIMAAKVTETDWESVNSSHSVLKTRPRKVSGARR